MILLRSCRLSITSTKRLVSCLLGLLFVVLTTHLILMEPMYRKLEIKSYSQMLHLMKRSTPSENPSMKKCLHFVVFDAQNYSGNLSFLEKPPLEWCVIVINSNNSSQLSSCADCLVLKDEWIKSTVVEFVEKKMGMVSGLTYAQYSKMAAYVYVLLKTPEWIYITDRPKAVPYPVLTKVMGKQVRTGPVYRGQWDIFEPCSHFIDPLMWREHGGDHGQSLYSVKVVSSDSIYQVVDSCFKPGMDESAQKEAFDMEAPVPYIMPGTYAAIDFRNVLVSRTNGWALVASLIPRSDQKNISRTIVSEDKSSSGSNISSSRSKRAATGVELSMMIQRMLWETNTRIGFIPGVSGGKRCSTCDVYSGLQSIGKEYRDSLLNWRCNSFEGVKYCLVQLASDMYLLDKTLETLIRAWMSLVNAYNISVVYRVPFSEDKLKEKHTGIPVYLSAARLLRKPLKNDTSRENAFQDSCKSHNKPYKSVIPDKHIFSKMLLIIVFNFPPLVSHIPLLDYLYGRHFKHILYCGESLTDFEQIYQRLNPKAPVSFVEIKHFTGYWGQNCMSSAIKMGYDVTGYLQMSDDVIMNVWNFEKLPYHQPWFQSNMRVAHIDHEIVPDVWINRYWWPWSQFSGKKSAVAAYKQLVDMMAKPEEGDMVSSFMENLYNITNCNRCFLYEASDIFYLPHELGSNFTFFSDIFSNNQVFLEITIPTVLAGITSDREVYRLRGNYLWFYDRDRYPFVYTEFDHFYHAWKFSQFRDKHHLRFFCRHVLSRVDKHILEQHHKIS